MSNNISLLNVHPLQIFPRPWKFDSTTDTKGNFARRWRLEKIDRPANSQITWRYLNQLIKYSSE